MIAEGTQITIPIFNTIGGLLTACISAVALVVVARINAKTNRVERVTRDTRTAVGSPNGNGAAMEALHTVITSLDEVKGAIYVESVKRDALARRLDDHLLHHVAGGE